MFGEGLGEGWWNFGGSLGKVWGRFGEGLGGGVGEVWGKFEKILRRFMGLGFINSFPNTKLIFKTHFFFVLWVALGGSLGRFGWLWVALWVALGKFGGRFGGGLGVFGGHLG